MVAQAIIQAELINQPQIEEKQLSINIEENYWTRIEKNNDKNDFEYYLREYPNGRFAPLARQQIRELTRQNNQNSANTPIGSESDIVKTVSELVNYGSAKIDLGKFGEASNTTTIMGECKIKFEERVLWNSKSRFKPSISQTTILLSDINITSVGVNEFKVADRPAFWIVSARTIQGRTFTQLITGYENKNLEKIKVPTKTENPTFAFANVALFMNADLASQYAKAFAKAARLCGAKAESF